MRPLGLSATLLTAAMTAFGSSAAAPAPDPQGAGVAVVVSPAAEQLSVTVYRNPERSREEQMQLSWLGGFALVTETRTVRVPAGEAVIRFEGVAGGIVPVSAIVTGLPGGTVEKNRDARLLSPAALVDGTLGRHVTLRRTDRRSGAVREEDAVIVAGPAGGVVVRTAAGVEALGCSGLKEKPLYPAVPEGLSAKPTLSVTTRSPRAATATVTLSYLATDFDWSASYVATVAPDGRTLDLFAWLTLANGNAEAFPNAGVQAVAGRLNRERTWTQRIGGELELRCYPLGTTTSDLLRRLRDREGEIVVTAFRNAKGRSDSLQQAVPAPPAPPAPPPPPEDLGDLKLYRVPERVTVAPNAQKQVALLARSRVPFDRVYRFALPAGQTVADAPARIVLRMRNDAAHGLALALPAGTTALYGTQAGGRQLLLGTGSLQDTAAGERFMVEAGRSRQVLASQLIDADKSVVVTLTNANPFAVAVEVPIGGAGVKLAAMSTTLRRVDGVLTWQTIVAANAEATFSYRP